MAASNAQAQNKKIKPIAHPNLVLKSPIAYHGGSDLSVLPIDKDGIAVCEKCGAIGVKHAFYTRQRKFCSVTCARSYTGYCNTIPEAGAEDGLEDYHLRKRANYKFKLMESSEALVGMIPLEPLPRLPGLWRAALDDSAPPPRAPPAHLWPQRELFGCHFLAAPVKLFSHAPLADMWDHVFEGMKVEVRNTDCGGEPADFFWVAAVLKLKGYMGLLRYEGFGADGSKDFWVNLAAREAHPVGWCATRGKPLIPPHTIENKYADWKTFLVRQLTGARTLPADFYSKVHESLKSRFRHGHTLEVVDKNRLSRVKVAIVDDIVEKRLHVRYFDSTPDNVNGFWCHEDSPLIHPVGWARAAGHELAAPPAYLRRLEAGDAHADDTTSDMFREYSQPDPHGLGPRAPLREGTKLEAVDPLNLSSVCEATVMRVLLRGYIMIRIDCYPPDEAGADWFCYHEHSPCIFPAGFCAERGIPLTVAPGRAPAAPPRSAPPAPPSHGFVSGMRLECVDLMEPRLVCVATVARVEGRLLRVHFDGWGEEYDQWLDCESPDIFPVGWCGAVGHRLEGPPSPLAPPPPGKPHLRKRGRKKKSKGHHEFRQRESEDICNMNNGNHHLAPPPEQLAVDDTRDQREEELHPVIKQEVNPCLPEDSKPDMELLMGSPMDTSPAEVPPTAVAISEPVKEEEAMWIPRLADSSLAELSGGGVEPLLWGARHVQQFLAVNDCEPYSAHFAQVDGARMLQLSKDDILQLLHMKVGPSLKIFHLIQQLKCKLKPACKLY